MFVAVARSLPDRCCRDRRRSLPDRCCRDRRLGRRFRSKNCVCQSVETYPRAHPPRTPHLLCIYLTFCLLSAFQDLRQKYKLELGRKHNKDFNRLHRKYHQERDDICSAHRQELKYKDKQIEVWHFQYLLQKTIATAD